MDQNFQEPDPILFLDFQKYPIQSDQFSDWSKYPIRPNRMVPRFIQKTDIQLKSDLKPQTLRKYIPGSHFLFGSKYVSGIFRKHISAL